MRKQFSTTIEEQIQNDFREYCKQNDIKLNDILEEFMKAVVDGNIKLKTEVSFEVK